ncbi:conserved hypothetical protein [Pediculus humanus corporis]|uniref:Outer dynein arm-docking complex subunit 4 n=1 Tax=Pediculus humanus subsp. corporis TaxID=121224 RepID=E0VPS5_PEDHC|nr:uncharacterized protein Phum_PHUM363920 [Pediculus humanus corporis]EEB15381.1 conserved hypothetical protein [Pediculus humanus corporis]
MKRSQSSHPITVQKSDQSIVRQRSFLIHHGANKQSDTFEHELSEHKIEKIYAEAEESFNKGDFEIALVKFSKGASLKPKNEAFASGVQKSKLAIINDLKENGINMQHLREDVEDNDYKTMPYQKSVDIQKETPDFKSDTARSIYTQCKKQDVQRVFNLKVHDGKGYKIIPATASDVKEYLQDKDYFKMKEQNAKEWKKLRSEMNKKLAEKEAFERFEKEAKVLEEKNTIRQYCEEQVILIGRYYQNNKIEDVIRFSENFIKYLNKKPDKMLPRKWIYLATAFNYLGRAYIEKEDFDKAKAFGEKLYKVAISSANSELITQSYILSGKVYVKFRKFEEAAFVWEKLIPMIENSEKKAWLFHEIGRCYFEMGKYDTSHKFGVDSEFWATKCSNSKWICSAKVLQGQCEMKKNNYTNAYKLFVEAKHHAEIVNDESILKYITSIEDLLFSALPKLTTTESEKFDDS